MHKFPYNWTLANAVFTKDKGTVFSCFAGGGGSSMGYKLAGFDVLGCNEIDPKMMAAYNANLHPKYTFCEPIQTFKDRADLPEELFSLDILDGSPPCSSFSMSGNREKDWGKKKKFREGQSEQVLDTLFFDFIDLAHRLQPKVVIAENVKGLLLGAAKAYVVEIYRAFDKAGYYLQHWLLDASKMGVPQRRERVFFVALRKDLAAPFLVQKDMFNIAPYLELRFNEPEIPFKDIEDFEGEPCYGMSEGMIMMWNKCEIGKKFSTTRQDNSRFSSYKLNPNKVLYTITSNEKQRAGAFHYATPRHLTPKEVLLACTFPTDYKHNKPYDICGMSVPPVMTAQIATEIYTQWLSKL